MQIFSNRSELFVQADSGTEVCPALALTLTDSGANEGIDVAVHLGCPDAALYANILANPESRVLLSGDSPDAEVFWSCVGDTIRRYGLKQIHVNAQCRFSPLAIDVSTRRIGYAEMRNVSFLRLVEDIMDEIQTREPGLLIDVAIGHRNSELDACFNF